MTYKELFEFTKEKYDIDDDKINYLLKYFLKLSSNDKVDMKSDLVNKYFDKVVEVEEGKPIQYVVGNVDFYGHSFIVEPGALIPRFVTEQLVYNTIIYINKYFKDNASLIDIGTGTGVIGITLKKEIPTLNVTLVDISEEALEIAAKNAKLLDTSVEIYKSDMLKEVINKGEKYDIIISNPPYLTTDQEIMDIVKKYEPSLALYGGTKYYDEILSNAKKAIKDKALIAFEIGANQAEEIIKLATKYFKDSPYEVRKDLEGRDRMFFLFYNLND